MARRIDIDIYHRVFNCSSRYSFFIIERLLSTELLKVLKVFEKLDTKMYSKRAFTNQLFLPLNYNFSELHFYLNAFRIDAYKSSYSRMKFKKI